MSVSPELILLLRENPSLTLTDQPSKLKKVKCSITGHEMPARLDAVKSYVEGKKYKRVRIAFTSQENKVEKQKEFLVPSEKRNHENQLFCKLTWRHLNNQPHHIHRHIQGKRFQKAFTKWEECQRTGETFKPRAGRKKRVDDDEDMDYMDDSDKESVDSFSDLYPAADFAELNLDDNDMNDGDAAGATAKVKKPKISKKQENGKIKGTKRKSKMKQKTHTVSTSSKKKREISD